MKNLFFALAFVLTGHLGIANTSNSALEAAEDFGTCTITITFINEEGQTESITYTTFAASELDCRIQAARISILLN